MRQPLTVGGMKKAAVVTLVAVAVIVIASMVVLRRSIDLPRFRDRITAELSRQLDAEVRCEAVRLKWFPLPRAVLDHVSVAARDSFTARVPSLSIYPRLLPLLRGRVEPSQVRLESPAIDVHRLPPLPPDHSAGPSDAVSRLQSHLASALAWAASFATSPVGGMVVVINDGRAELPIQSQTVQLQDLTGRIALPPHRLAIELQSTSDHWQHLAVELSVDPASAAGSGRVEIRRLQPDVLAAALLGPDLRIGDSSLDIDMHVRLEGIAKLQADIAAAVPVLSMWRGTNEVVLRGQRLSGGLAVDGTARRVTVYRSQLDYPRVQFSGTLSIDPDTAKLEVDGSSVDVRAVRYAATVLAGNARIVGRVAHVLRGGTVPHITISSEAASLSDLGSAEALRIEGRLVDGRIYVPGVALHLGAVSGDGVIAAGVLTGTGVVARVGNSETSAGTLRVGLRGKAPELQVDSQAQADAGELAALLRRLVKNDTFQRAFEGISDVSGSVAGKFILSGTTKSVKVQAETSEFDVSGRAQGLRPPFRLTGRHFLYDAGSIETSDVDLTAGTSHLSELVARILPGGSPPLDAAAGAAHLALDEVYPWVATSGWLPDSDWNPTALSGSLSLQFLHLTGPFGMRHDWEIELIGSARQLVIDSAALRQRLAIRYPLSLFDAHLKHAVGSGTAFAARVVAPGDLSGVVDLTANGERLDIKQLRLRDHESDAALALSLTPQDVSVTFKGYLTKATLDAVIDDQVLAGSVEGDARAYLRRDQPTRSDLDGRVHARGLIVPLRGGGQMTLSDASIEGQRGLIHVDAGMAPGADGEMRVRGELKRSPRAWTADLDLTAGRIDWGAIEPLLAWADGQESATRSTGEAPSWQRWLRGSVRVAAESFSYRGFQWEPVHAVALFTPRGVSTTISDTRICGIATPGTIDIAGQELMVTFAATAKDQHLDDLLHCLGMERDAATGHYSLDAVLTANGVPAQLGRSAQGSIVFKSANGRLHALTASGRILALLNVATGALQDIPEITKKGLPYDSVDVVGEMRGGVLVLNEASFSGPSVNCAAEGSVGLFPPALDLTLLVAPLKIVNAVVGSIPIVSTILGGTLVSIPIKVTGHPQDPQVTPLAPTAVGEGLLALMKRTLTAPMKLIPPRVSEKGSP